MSEAPDFNPERLERHDVPATSGGDDADGRIYVYHNDDIRLAVKVALATQRPLLLSGPSGCGKSSLAPNVARYLGWRYYRFVVRSTSEARDLQWTFDNLRRLNDAQAEKTNVGPDAWYVEPGPLWWAIDPESAKRRGSSDELPEGKEATDPNPSLSSKAGEHAVVLVDEIDKADPDFPNNLLVPFGSFEIDVTSLGKKFSGSCPPLIFITNNDERELPPAFVRRCIALKLEAPKGKKLVEIGKAHHPEGDPTLLSALADHVDNLRKQSKDEGVPSTAEYLDAVRACIELGMTPEHQDFALLSQLTLEKTPARPAGGWE